MTNTFSRINSIGVVPVIAFDHTDDAVLTAQALRRGCVNTMEITLRTDAALSAIETVSVEYPDMLVGAGTVLTLQQCKDAVSAGAEFIVSPGLNPAVVSWCLERNIAVIPGCVTPTEITQALLLGVNTLKFFPANIYGGLEAMKALHAPFRQVRFIPTGGVNGKNLSEYSNIPYISAVGGTWLCSQKDIAAHNFDTITTLARAAYQTMHRLDLLHAFAERGAAASVRRTLADLFDLHVTEIAAPPAVSGVPAASGYAEILSNHVERTGSLCAQHGFLPDPAHTSLSSNGAIRSMLCRNAANDLLIRISDHV